MKALGLNVDTGEVREFDSAEEALAYAKAQGYHAVGGGVFHEDDAEAAIDAAMGVFGKSTQPKDEPEVTASKFTGIHKAVNDMARHSTVRLDEYSRGVANTLHALAHAFEKNGSEIADVLDANGDSQGADWHRHTRDADFSYLHALGDTIVAGENAEAIIESIRRAGQ